MLPLLVFAALLAVLGWSVARILLFPLGFLYFALPLWGDLVGILQHLSVNATHALIWLTGLPAYMDGNFVRLPAGTLEIADGCSGLHFLIVGLAMAALYGELSRDSLLRRIAWLCLMGGLAIVANWLRIFVIVAAAYATEMKTFLVTVDHYWFGWLVFAATFAAFLWIANRSAGAHGPESVKPLPAATTGLLGSDGADLCRRARMHGRPPCAHIRGRPPATWGCFHGSHRLAATAGRVAGPAAATRHGLET